MVKRSLFISFVYLALMNHAVDIPIIYIIDTNKYDIDTPESTKIIRTAVAIGQISGSLVGGFAGGQGGWRFGGRAAKAILDKEAAVIGKCIGCTTGAVFYGITGFFAGKVVGGVAGLAYSFIQHTLKTYRSDHY